MKPLDVLYLSLAAFVLSLAVCAGLITHRVDQTGKEIQDSAIVLHRTLDTVDAFASEEVAIIRSPAYQKNIEHTTEAGDLAAKTIAQFSRRTLPRVDKAFDQLAARLNDFGLTETQLTRLASNSADLVKNADASLTGPDGLIPALSKLVTRGGVTLDELDKALVVAAEGLNITTSELKRRLADPKIDKMMDEALGILKEGHGTMEQVHKASESAPGIATSIESIAKTSNKFARITLIANILGTLGRAVLP